MITGPTTAANGGAGAATAGPASLLLVPALTTWKADTATDPLTITVSAFKGDGAPDTFTVSVSDESVVSVSQSDGAAILTPRSPGSSVVTFTSDSDASVTRTITATIELAYEDSSATYGALATVTEPAVGDTSVHVDTWLKVTFDDVPVLGSGGSVRVFRLDDDSLVDVILVRGETDTLGPESGTNAGRQRFLNTRPLTIDGNTLMVSLHDGVLEYGTDYHIGISPEAVTGALGGEAFAGIGKAAGWTFTTKAESPTGPDVSSTTRASCS